MVDRFPVIKAGYIFNKIPAKLNNSYKLVHKELEIKYPCRLDAMAINPAAVTYNDTMVFTPGEVVVSVEKYVKVTIKVDNEDGGVLKISDRTRRKVLVKHSYLLMCNALNVMPSVSIDVEDSEIPKHCGFGSSSSTIAAVAVGINELYGNPIESKDLIKYLASNHGEEISDNNEDELKVVQCIGGGATNGQTEEGIIIIGGKSCTIAKMNYEGDILIGIPNDFVEQDAEVLMTLEEQNLWKFKATGDKYKDSIAYTFLHRVLPDMTEGKISSLADIVYDYRYNMGSIQNCSFVFERMNEIAENTRHIYEDGHCKFLALSSVGPAFFTITDNEEDLEYCKKEFEKQNMKTVTSKVCNHKYIVNYKDDFWQRGSVNIEFYNKKPSKYITDVIDEITSKNIVNNAIDIGCGGGRYSKYISSKGAKVTAIDKNEEMFKLCEEENNPNIAFKVNNMIDLQGEEDNHYDIALSIGVIHNSKNIEEYKSSFKEIARVLKQDCYAIISVFTNDVITKDLSKGAKQGEYFIKDRPPMVLLGKDDIKEIVKESNLRYIEDIDEHITDVGDGGKRNVYTFLLKK